MDLLNGMETIATFRNSAPMDETRLRLLWRGAMVKGRGAKATWEGRVGLSDAEALKTAEVNAWNPDRGLRKEADGSFTWSSVTAGNFGAIDFWLEEGPQGALEVETNHLSARVPLSQIGREDKVFPAGGLDLELRLFRLPAVLTPGPLTGSQEIELASGRDNPLWLRVTTEDGFQAWTSPVYIFTRPERTPA